MASIFAGTENFNPAFQGRQLAIESGRGAGASISRGMNSAEARKRGELAREESEFSRGVSDDQLSRLPAMKSWLDPQIQDDEPAPFTGETSEPTGLSLPSPRDWARSGSGDTLNVAKAQKIIKAFTADPSWLADPRTAHAANSIFKAASEVVGMNIKLEQLNNQYLAAEGRTQTGKQIGTILNDLSKQGGEAAAWGSQWYGRGEDGIPKFQNPDYWQEIASGASRFQTPTNQPTFRTLVDPVSGETVKVVHGPSGAPTVVHTPAEAEAKAASALKNRETEWIISENALGDTKTIKMTPKAFAAGFSKLPEFARTNAANLAKLSGFYSDQSADEKMSVPAPPEIQTAPTPTGPVRKYNPATGRIE